MFRDCRNCGERKPCTQEFFSLAPACREGLRYTCRVCFNRQQKQRYEARYAARFGEGAPVRPDFKICSSCQKQKLGSDFSRCVTAPDGFQAYCRECRTESARNYRQSSLKYLVRSRKRARTRKPQNTAQAREKSTLYYVKTRIALSVCESLGVDLDALAKEKYDADWSSNKRKA